MLILGRKKEEVIVIGDNIRITVTSIRGDLVMLGIEAPANISVDRLEIYESKKQQKEINRAK